MSVIFAFITGVLVGQEQQVQALLFGIVTLFFCGISILDWVRDRGIGD